MGRRKKVGDIYRFDFDEKYHCFCQILEANDVAFFDYCSDKNNDDIEYILQTKEVFRIFCDQDCFKGEKWKYLKTVELSEEKKNINYKYHFSDGSYSLYKQGIFTPCTKKDCVGLEIFALWTEKGISQRLNYSFFNKELPDHVKSDLPFYE